MLSFKRVLDYLIIVLVVLIPFIVYDELYNSFYVAKELWFSGIILVIVLQSFLTIWNAKSFKLNISDILFLCFIICVLVNEAFFVKMSYSIEKVLSYIFALILYSWSRRLKNAQIFVLLIAFVLIACIQSVIGLLQLYGIIGSHNPAKTVYGTFSNSPTYALYLASIFPIAFYFSLNRKTLSRLFISSVYVNDPKTDYRVVRRSNKRSVLRLSMVLRYFVERLHTGLISMVYILSVLTTSLIFITIPATMNRTSWVMVFFSSLIILINFSREKWIQINLIKRKVFIFLFAGIVLLGGIGGYFLKKDSADGRLLVFKITVAKVFEKPIIGHGTGSFFSQYNYWQSKWFESNPKECNGRAGYLAGNVTLAYNEFLEILVENGLISFLFFTGSIILIFYPNRKFESLKKTPVKYILFSLIVSSFFSYPLKSVPTFITFFIAFGLSAQHMVPVYTVTFNLDNKPGICYILRFFLFLVCFTIITLLSTVSRNKFRNSKDWQEASLLFYYKEDEKANEIFATLYDDLKNSGVFLAEYGKCLSEEEDFHNSLKVLERSKIFVSDPVLYCNLGNVYKTLGYYSHAEEHFKRAHYMRPNMIYPQYLLAKLYIETSDTLKACYLIDKILSTKDKVNSSAALDMRDELREIQGSKCKCYY